MVKRTFEELKFDKGKIILITTRKNPKGILVVVPKSKKQKSFGIDLKTGQTKQFGRLNEKKFK